MPDRSDFWEDGSLPSPVDLRRFLENYGLTDEDVGRIVRAYQVDIYGTSQTEVWAPAQVNEWVYEQISTQGPSETRGEAEPGQPRVPRQPEDEEDPRITSAGTENFWNRLTTWMDTQGRVRDTGGASPSPEALGTSLALGFRVDEDGNPIIDPQTGAPAGVSPEELWGEIAGLRFDMGSLSVPIRRGQRGWTPAERFTGMVGERVRQGGEGYAHRGMSAMEARAAARQDARPQGRRVSARGGAEPGMRRFISPSQMLAILQTMNPDELVRLQQQMWEAGMYEAVGGEGALPAWGEPDVATREALIQTFLRASTEPSMSVSGLLDRLAQERIYRRGQGEGTGEGADASQLPAFMPEVTSAESLGQQVDEIAQSLMGRFADPDKRDEIVSTLQGREVEHQRQLWERQVADARSRIEMTSVGPGGEDIDRFMTAISGQESGGDYDVTNPDSGAYGRFQIMPGNWGPWAERAGLGRGAPRTPENQEIVARRVMLDYFEQFGNWRDVAVAWYAGPGRVAQVRNSRTPQGRYPSIAAYADQIMERMGQVGGTPMAGAAGEANVFDPVETFDPTAEAEAILKAQDPVGWQGHEFSERAIEFFQLLGGVV